MIQIFLADGTDERTNGRTDQPKVVQEVLADLKMMIICMYDDLKAMSKKFLCLWIQGIYLSRDDPI